MVEPSNQKRSVLGLDIGGANLKAAHTDGAARSRPFPLWKNPQGLAAALAELLRQLPAAELLAATMTGELCDCYATKRQGVNAILDAVEEVAGGTAVSVWQNNGKLVDVPAARAASLRTAAANWLALATFAGRFVPEGPALVIDVGSTTTDIIPLLDGRPMPAGRTDPERMRSRELVYTGVRRTPVMALLGPAVAAEMFATTLDAYLVLGKVPEDPADHDTADGRPATRAAAHARLARLVGADAETCHEEETSRLAKRATESQLALIRGACAPVAARLPGPPRAIVLAGAGEFLAREVLAQLPHWEGATAISLAERLGPPISEAACAYALALLAQEGSHGRTA